MLSIFGSASTEGGNIWANPAIQILLVIAAIFVFLKFCTWAKKFSLNASFKKWVFIFTGLGLVVFNVLYMLGNKQIMATGDWGGATTALLLSMVWVFVFAFALMAETKAD